jgi:hypothetical protein
MKAKEIKLNQAKIGDEIIITDFEYKKNHHGILSSTALSNLFRGHKVTLGCDIKFEGENEVLWFEADKDVYWIGNNK